MPSALTGESENLRTHWFKTKGLDWSSLLNQCAEGLPSLQSYPKRFINSKNFLFGLTFLTFCDKVFSYSPMIPYTDES